MASLGLLTALPLCAYDTVSWTFFNGVSGSKPVTVTVAYRDDNTTKVFDLNPYQTATLKLHRNISSMKIDNPNATLTKTWTFSGSKEDVNKDKTTVSSEYGKLFNEAENDKRYIGIAPIGIGGKDYTKRSVNLENIEDSAKSRKVSVKDIVGQIKPD